MNFVDDYTDYGNDDDVADEQEDKDDGDGVYNLWQWWHNNRSNDNFCRFIRNNHLLFSCHIHNCTLFYEHTNTTFYLQLRQNASKKSEHPCLSLL